MKAIWKKAAAALALCAVMTTAAAAFSDVPAGHWAEQNIADASSAGFISGYEDGTFGMGRTLTRAEFVSMLSRLMGWSPDAVYEPPVFSDVAAHDWYSVPVKLAVEGGAIDEGGLFRPDQNITRAEMAVMLVRSLGYDNLLETTKTLDLPFTDVTNDRAYITIAYDFGIIAGKSATTFDPAGTALREEAAAMMMRLYEKYTTNVDWLHGFYALSSWSQRSLGAQMDSISFGWSRLCYDASRGAWLNTTTENGNDWRFPDGYQDALDALSAQQRNLAVTMTDQTAARAILTDEAQRAQAVQAIAAQIDGVRFTGVTIDFEGMRGQALREGLTAFVSQLRAALGENAPIYVCVHPVLLHGGSYFDAYDYRALGDLADKIILMAHDYAATSMDAAMMAAGFTVTPVTPFDEVYYALRCATDEDTGVRDVNKLALAVSTSSTAGWRVVDGQVTNSTALHPSMETVQQRLAQAGSVREWSVRYRNPWLTYADDNGDTVVLWYEDGSSIAAKLQLARMFGVNGLSVWRLGAIQTTAPLLGGGAVWDQIVQART